MNKNILQTYLSDRYQGSRSFLENIIFPIFGEDSFEDGHETEFLNQKDEYRKTSETLGVRSVRQVGKIEVGVEPLYIFDVTVSDRVRMERNRVGIQRLVRSIMGTYSCAFMLFHYEKTYGGTGVSPSAISAETGKRLLTANAIRSCWVLNSHATQQDRIS